MGIVKELATISVEGFTDQTSSVARGYRVDGVAHGMGLPGGFLTGMAADDTRVPAGASDGSGGFLVAHSIWARIMRREAEYLPIQSNFVIFDTDDQERVVKSAIREMNINEKLHRPASVLGSISRAKNELIGADDYPTQTYRDEIVKRVYAEYQKRLIASNAVDFDDILLYTAQLLEEQPSVRDKYAQRFRHVLVDEFQDTNLAQYALVKQLASFHRNIFCVGDPDQSIYAWRGADWRNVQRFDQDFPDARTILLEQNYRSRQTILDAAMGVIDRAQNRRKKRLFTDNR